MMRLISALLLLAGVSNAATYYVATDGSDGAAGTLEAPWRSLGKLNDLNSSNTIYFRGGVYSSETDYLWPGRIGGASVGVSNINYFAYPGESPIFTGLTNKFNVPVLNLSLTCRDLVFRGLTFSNNWQHANLQNQYDVTFDACTFGYMGSNLPSYEHKSVALYNSHFVTFTNCLFTHWGSSLSGDDFGSFLHIGAFADYYSTNNYGHLVTDCHFEYGGHDLLQIYSSNNVVRRCTFFNPNWMPYAGNLYGNRHIELITSWAQPNLIEDCDFGYSGIPVDTFNTVAAVETATSRLILRRNRFFDNQGVAVSFYQKGYGATPSQNYIYHNSMLWSGLNPYALTNGYTWYQAALLWAHASTTNNRVVNNAIWRVGPAGTNGAMAALSDTAINSSHFAGNLTNTVDPLWVRTNTSTAGLSIPNLQLQPGSPAIQSGDWLTTITSGSGSGSGTNLTVADAGYFYDGWGIPGEVGDEIQLQGQTTTARITAVDYTTQTITLNSSMTWTNGQGVALIYNGSAPDVGAFEFYGSRAYFQNVRFGP